MTGLAVAVAAAGPALADATLVSSSPVNGATVGAPPQAVTFTFNEFVQTRLTTVTLADARGGTLPVAPAFTDRATVIQPLPPDLGPGEYLATYRIVSADGHPVTGRIRFTVAPAQSAQSAPTPPAGAGSSPAGDAASPPAGTTATLPADAGAAQADSASDAAIPADPVAARQPADGRGAGARGWPWVAGAAILLIGATGTAVVRQRRRTALP